LIEYHPLPLLFKGRGKGERVKKGVRGKGLIAWDTVNLPKTTFIIITLKLIIYFWPLNQSFKSNDEE
jgi:hypothetical protein